MHEHPARRRSAGDAPASLGSLSGLSVLRRYRWD